MRSVFSPWVGKISWKRERLPTPIFWPKELHGLYPWDCKELDTTEKLSLSSLYELNLTQHLFAHSISLDKPHKTFTMSLVNKSKCWEDVFVLWLEMACKLWDHCPLPGWQYLALCIFHLAISEFILKKKKNNKKPIIINKVFLWVLWDTLESCWPWRGGCGSPFNNSLQTGV